MLSRMMASLMVSRSARGGGSFRHGARCGCLLPNLSSTTKRVILRDGMGLSRIVDITEEFVADEVLKTQDGARIELPNSDEYDDDDDGLPANLAILTAYDAI